MVLWLLSFQFCLVFAQEVQLRIVDTIRALHVYHRSLQDQQLTPLYCPWVSVDWRKLHVSLNRSWLVAPWAPVSVDYDSYFYSLVSIYHSWLSHSNRQSSSFAQMVSSLTFSSSASLVSSLCWLSQPLVLQTFFALSSNFSNFLAPVSCPANQASKQSSSRQLASCPWLVASPSKSTPSNCPFSCSMRHLNSTKLKLQSTSQCHRETPRLVWIDC